MRAVILRALISLWVVALAIVAHAQRSRDEVPVATQLYVDRQIAGQAGAIAQIRQDVAIISETANRAAAEVKEMRLAVWGGVGTMLVSLFLQVVEIRRRRSSSDGGS